MFIKFQCYKIKKGLERDVGNYYIKYESIECV